MPLDNLPQSALEQARLIRRGEVSSEELTRHYLDVIARRDGRLSAFVQVLERQSLAEARRADRRRRRDRAPFLGVPTAIKDLHFLRGSVTRFGSRGFWFWSPVDDATSAQLRRGGFVFLGKTSTPELGVLPVTEPLIHPPTRNPWDPGVSPGGSSGGAGAAVAAEMIPVAQGSDGAGSIRIPSALCGLVGLKPSRGRVKNAYGLDDRALLYTSGPITHTVADAAAMLDVMAGVTVGRPHWAPPPERSFLELSRRRPGKLRIRFTTGSTLGAADVERADAVARTAKVLEGLGHHVEEGPPLVGSIEEFLPLWQEQTAGSPVLSRSRTEDVTKWLSEPGRRLAKADMVRLTFDLAARVLSWFGDADVWLTPTVAVPPVAVGAWKGLEPAEVFREASRFGLFTAPFNVSGQPAMSVPAGMSGQGHPIGIQLAGKMFGEATLLSVARELEEAQPWEGRRAPLAEG